jgi:microcystin-dependent protein
MSEPFIGQIVLFPYNFAPRGWAFCNGQLLSIAQNTALFSLLGTTYGGDGRTTFALPDLRGRVPISAGQGPGLSDYSLGETGGAEDVTLITSEMPSHNHTAQVQLKGSNANASTDLPSGAVLARSARGNIYAAAASLVDMSSSSAASTIGAAGGSQPHENRQPFLTLNYCIALEGIFPSRN